MISLDKELREIVELTPDYQNIDAEFSHYERMATRDGETRRADNLMWNDVVDSAEMLHSYLKKNPSVANEYDGNLVKIVDSIYGERLVDASKHDIVRTLKKMETIDVLSKEVEQYSGRLPDYFHGTGSGALEGITREGKLLSENELKRLGMVINSGEGYLNRKSRDHYYVSLSESPGRAIDSHAYIDGISRLGDFPVVIGFDRNAVESQGAVYTFDADAEPEERCIKNEVSLGAATHVFAPIAMKDRVNDFVEKYKLRFVPIEDLQKKAGVNFNVLRFN